MDTTTADTATDPQPAQQSLTSTTAPGKFFGGRAELAAHYKSAWHAYNLKRREAGLPVLLEQDFQARLHAAQAVQREQAQLKNKTDHLKKDKRKKKGRSSHVDVVQIKEATQGQPDASLCSTDKIQPTETTAEVLDDVPQAERGDDQKTEDDDDTEIEIDPCQSLFDRHRSETVRQNLHYMERHYGFFVADREYLIDITGLIGYCHEVVRLGAQCLYCCKQFRSPAACRNHMVATRHTKVGAEMEAELGDFYDFTTANEEFLGNRAGVDVENNEAAASDSNDDDSWEDIPDDGEDMETDESEGADDDFYAGFEEQVARLGWSVTPLGELLFPDGRIVGHRGLRQYYKQRAPSNRQSPAVVAARAGASERLYRGRVYQLGGSDNSRSTPETNKTLSLLRAGLTSPATGRTGQGILVAQAGAYSQLSIYRYRAAIRKQRRGEFQGQRLYQKTNQNMNRMDKKHNRLMNNVSVAHTAR